MLYSSNIFKADSVEYLFIGRIPVIYTRSIQFETLPDLNSPLKNLMYSSQSFLLFSSSLNITSHSSIKNMNLSFVSLYINVNASLSIISSVIILGYSFFKSLNILDFKDLTKALESSRFVYKSAISIHMTLC